MAEYIEREEAYSLAKKICDAIDKVPRCILGHDILDFIILDFIDDIPAADVREVVMGKWIKTVGENGVTSACRCSECGFEDNRYSLFSFCPNCGARMEES